MAMKVVGVETEKVVDNNPNTYLKRAENKLKIGEYDNAISELELAMKYSNDNKKTIEQCDRIKLALVRGNIKKLDFFFQNKSEEEIREMAVKVINNFEGLLNSLTFKLKCKVEANKNGVPYTIVKNGCIKRCFNKINSALNREHKIDGYTVENYNIFFDNVVKNMNKNNIEDYKMLIGQFYLVNIEDEIFTNK